MYIIKKNQGREALTAQNENKETPLHRAAARGSVRMCKCIVEAGHRMGLYLLTSYYNKWGQNPIFVAALDDRKHAFFYLLKAAEDFLPGIQPDQLLRSAGLRDTVLHSAIKREHCELAFHIIRKYPGQLLDRCNAKGMTPLHVLASKPSAFRSGRHLSWWKQIICYSTHVEPLKFYDPDTTTDPWSPRHDFPEKYLICSGIMKAERDPENPKSSDIKGIVPQNYATCFGFLATVFINFCDVLGLGM
ncbi:uncharacterized protein LOC129295002 [Prosopis cineraria]|uniref:uncharacterized protein LOC129295002 n=1 Tax=Prosopis cineraria TaxID=364024 RepID=UPI00240F1ABB|nr:uncharacterized protein LOC129295002 [Prosopis cineraria]